METLFNFSWLCQNISYCLFIHVLKSQGYNVFWYFTQITISLKHLEVKFKKGLQQRQQVKFDEFKSAITVILKSTIMLVVNTK